MTHDEVRQAYERFGHLVQRRCIRVLRESAAADDAVQETFLRLWRYGDAFRVAESKVSWLYRVAERCCFDQMARTRRRGEQDLDGDHERAADLQRSLEDGDLVMKFLDQFDERTRQVAILHYLDQLTQQEIADATGWSRQTISKKLSFLHVQASALRAQVSQLA